MAYQAVDEIMARCEKDGVEFWKAVQLEDCEENGISEEESWNQMTHMWNSMKESVAAYDPEAISRSGLVGREGKLMDAYREQEKTLCVYEADCGSSDCRSLWSNAGSSCYLL